MILILCLIKDNGILSEVFMWVPWCWERLKQAEEEATEDEMVGWHHRLNGHEFKQTPGDSEGRGSLACCRPWRCKELDAMEQLSNNSPQFQLSSLLRTACYGSLLEPGETETSRELWGALCIRNVLVSFEPLPCKLEMITCKLKLKEMICECVWCIICA